MIENSFCDKNPISEIDNIFDTTNLSIYLFWKHDLLQYQNFESRNKYCRNKGRPYAYGEPISWILGGRGFPSLIGTANVGNWLWRRAGIERRQREARSIATEDSQRSRHTATSRGDGVSLTLNQFQLILNCVNRNVGAFLAWSRISIFLLINQILFLKLNKQARKQIF